MRVVDSGLRSAREHLSLTEALCARRRIDASPDTLRFQHFPRAAIVGRHQRVERELNLDWIAARGVETARRMTGGGAIVMGPGILGWELVISRARAPAALADVTREICAGVAEGLLRLGADAAFRPRNDIEVAGRKISGTGGYFDGPALVFQGTVLLELDRDLLLGALASPERKLGKRGLEALGDRVCDLKDVLGSTPAMRLVEDHLADRVAARLGMDAAKGDLRDDELADARAIFTNEIGTEAFVLGLDDVRAAQGETRVVTREGLGGAIEVALRMRDGGEAIVESALIAGDFFVTPPRAVADLEARLRGVSARGVEAAAREFLASSGATFHGFEQSDIVSAIAEAAHAGAGESRE